ncbi:MAG: potassium/proton antiporter [Gemmatimonadota bacterium]
MFPVDGLILVGGILLLFAIASSKFSSRIGVPVLVLFLGLGMVAGSEGLGGIAFENYSLAHGIGTLALALILFDGGLRTPLANFRVALAPSLALATLGVVITAAATGAAAAWILGVPLLNGILLGSIVGSTDAAAVFSLLRGQGIHLRQRLAATLEIESGSNDPMAVFLTVGILEVLLGRLDPGWGLASFFLVQVGVGLLAGLLVGKLAVEVNNRINLDAAGLYPILTAASGFLAYGAAASLGGSGFLAVYLTGIVLGNSRIVFHRGILLFTDGMAWLGQIVMFVMLGMLSFPSQLLEVAGEGLLVAVVLIFLARPLAVFLILAPFRFELREIAFLSWIGLKGAVPIVLATYPLLFGLPGALLLFNVVFFVVLVSAVTQGWSLPAVARMLRLEVPSPPTPPVTLDITSLKHVDGDIVEFTVGPNARAAGHLVRDLAIPETVVVALIARGEQIIPPRGSTRINPGDHVFVVLRPEVRPLVNRLFSEDHRDPGGITAGVEFPLLASATIGDLEEFYGIALDAPSGWTLARLIQEQAGVEAIYEGHRVVVPGAVLRVREIGEHGIETIGLEILGPAIAEGPPGEPSE